MGSKHETKVKWKFSIPKTELKIRRFELQECIEHPLKQSHVTLVQAHTKDGKKLKEESNITASKIIDPLSVPIEGLDPLSLIAAEMALDSVDKITPTVEQVPVGYLKPWSEVRTFILNKFTTSQKLTLTSSFLSAGEQKGRIHEKTVIEHRLEQLDDFEEGSMSVDHVTPAQYAESIARLNRELVHAWNRDARVNALKIAIQCSKLLVDTSVMQFYPSKFVLITDVLDIFGSLVYERLKSKAESPLGLSGSKETANEVARETCRNWFFKIASIRELVPRLYVEAAILKSYSFLNNKEFGEAVGRLTAMVRGIGDPLVSVYARCYLCRIASSVQSVDRAFLQKNLFDFFSIYHQLFSPYVRTELNKQKIELTFYLGMYEPALDWIMQGLSNTASSQLFDEIVSHVAKKKNNGLLLNSILINFKKNYIASKADCFINLISTSSDGEIPQAVLLISLGECLQNHLVENPISIREKAWKLILSLPKANHFMSCAQAWSTFIVKNFTHEVVNAFLSDIIAVISKSGIDFTTQLQSIIIIIVENIQDVQNIFLMDKFLPALDLIESESVKVVVCKKLLEVFVSKQGVMFTDPVTTGGLIFVAKILHDSINALTVDDVIKQIGNLISRLIRLVNFKMDFEKQLNFYVEARGTFTNIDTVLATLVQCVVNLAWETGRIVKGEHTKKTGSFVRACNAYCYITIPSISSIPTRLKLYLLTSQVALFNQCLGQADACVKAALSQCMDLPASIIVGAESKSTEPFLAEFISNMLSTLVVIPDCPEQGAAFLVRGLINMLSHSTTEQNAHTVISLYLKVIDMLAVMAQPVYPYHVKKVDSNDVFYGSDPKFISELGKICSIVVDEIISYLKILGSNNYYNKQSKLAFELFIRVVLHGDLSSSEMSNLAINLWNLSKKHNALDKKITDSVIAWLKNNFENSPPHIEALNQISSS